MKATLLPALILFALVTASMAHTCREVARDASGRVVQTIERQKQAGGTERAVIRDASGRVAGTATTQARGSTTQTQYRDASGRVTGSAVTQGSTSGSARTTYRDASGRVAGSADTSNVARSGSRTQFRDASGRSAGSATISGGTTGSATATRRDASGRVTGSSTASGKCQGVARVPTPPVQVRHLLHAGLDSLRHELRLLFRRIECLEDLPEPLAIPVVGDRETHPAGGFHAVNRNRRGTEFHDSNRPRFFPPATTRWL